MKRNVALLFTIALLLATTERSPAPIQEIPEASPTPAATESKANVPESTPRAKATKSRVKSASASTSAKPAPNPTNRASSNDNDAIPKGAVHLVARSDSDFRQIFTYFRFPGVVAPAGTTGLYRIEISPDGTVAAVTILKSMGLGQDTAFEKAFVSWKAAPGPLRIVDVPRHIFTYYHVTH